MMDLWLQPADQQSVQSAAEHAGWLDDGETSRWRRYLTSESRDLFLVAHVATRSVLSEYGDHPPDAWQFTTGVNGRPEIVDGPAGLRFNLSHTEGMVAVLVHGPHDCGVDIEHRTKTVDMASVSRQVFTDAEHQSIFSLPPALRSDRFYHLWTLKEAVLKATGKGFALPLRQFGFDLDADQHVQFECEPGLKLKPTEWQFLTHRTESGHIASIAAHATAPEAIAVTIRQPAPFLGGV